MRRALLAILLFGVLAPASVTTAFAATSPETVRTILRDCEDGSLSGSYRASELRDAVRNIGTDLDQYSDCRDTISSAILRAVSRRDTASAGGTGAAAGSPESAGGTRGTPGGGDEASPSGASDGAADFGGGALLSPDGPEESAELARLRTAAPASAVVGGEPVPVGGARHLAAILAHELPLPLIVALALLTLGALAASLPSLRRRLLDRRAP